MGTVPEVSKEIYIIPESREERTYVSEDSLSHLTQRTFASPHDSELYLDPERVEVYDERDDGISPWIRVPLLIIGIFIFIIPFVVGAGHPLIFLGIMAFYMIVMWSACHWLAKKEDEMTSDTLFHSATFKGTRADSFSLFLQNIRRLAKMTDEERGAALEEGTIARDIAEWALRSQKYYNQSKSERAHYVHSLLERKILPLARIYFDQNEEYSILYRLQALEDLKFHLMDNSRDYDKYFRNLLG